MKAKITTQLETSDHDGYCSGEDCEYEVQTHSYIVDLPDQFKNYSEGKLNNFDKYNFEWDLLLPEPKLNNDGSFYCNLSKESETHGLNRHDYRYTIISIEIIDPEFINKNGEYIKKLDMCKIFSDD
jgi:hypothetical protein